MKIGMISLGCAKNRVDSEEALGLMREAGHEIVSDINRADVIFINTCGFIQPAKEEAIETIFEAVALKEKDPKKKIIVTGCLAQRYAEALISEIPEIDGLMGVAEYTKVNEVLNDVLSGKKPVLTEEGERFPCVERVLTTSEYSAYVKISDGCDNKCTYCAIPLIRGKYASRKYEDIIDECKRLAQRGVTEITLIAQDTSRYGSDFEGKPLLLSKLLKEVAAIDGVHWVRVLYCYPDTVTDELIETITNEPKISPYLDLPLQHIDAAMLRKMNRRGSPEDVEKLIEKCRAHKIIVRTTMMVGFPGETEEQFQTLMDFVEKTKFDRLGAFAFSPEEGTLAAEMSDQIDEDVKQQRLDELMMAQQAISMEISQARVGSCCEVLVEGKKRGKYYGRSIYEAPESDGSVIFTSGRKLKPGQYVSVKITDCDAYDLFGEEYDEPAE